MLVCGVAHTGARLLHLLLYLHVLVCGVARTGARLLNLLLYLHVHPVVSAFGAG